ncbi:MAG: hypothetical protein IIC32_03710 [Chloroflexi bacterium]|nr:hypothetical protein [Chloroflexota bacterium]
MVFGCVDTDSGRLILNELSLADLVPYIDSGVGITVEEGRVTEAGGRVVVWVPGRPCLLCCNEVNTRIAAEELESPEEREFRQRHGYVEGANLPEPAIISLNGTVASLAVTEFLGLVTGFRPSNHYTYTTCLRSVLARGSRGRTPRALPAPSRGLEARRTCSATHDLFLWTCQARETGAITKFDDGGHR